jgi:hypothetical protein
LIRIYQNSSSYSHSGSFPKRLEIQTDNYFRFTVEGDKITASMDKNANGSYTDLASYSYTGLTTLAGGTVGFYSDDQARTIVDTFKVKITFTNEELAAIENSYVTNNYFFVKQNKPAIPVTLNSKVNLNNVVVEFADGSMMMGSDVIWENNNGAIAYDDATNSFSIYASGLFTVKAKKNAADAGTEIYLVTPDANGLYTIYDHTFTADDLAPVQGHTNGKRVVYQPNSMYWWGTWMATYSGITGAYTESASSDWALRNSTVASHVGDNQEMFEIRSEVNPAYPPRQSNFNECTYWPIGESTIVTAEDITSSSAWVFEANKGFGISTNQPGWTFLKPESDAGKLISRFSDYTIDCTYVTNLQNAGYTFEILGRFSADTTEYENGKEIFRLGEEKYLGAYAPHGAGAFTKLSLAYSGAKSVASTIPSYTIVKGNEYTAKVKLSGNSVTFSMKESTASEFTQLYTAQSGIDTSSLTGTIAIKFLNETRQRVKAISVSLD